MSCYSEATKLVCRAVQALFVTKELQMITVSVGQKHKLTSKVAC